MFDIIFKYSPLNSLVYGDYIKFIAFIIAITGSILLVLGEVKGYWLVIIECLIILIYFASKHKYIDVLKQLLIIIIPIIGIYQFSPETFDFNTWFKYNKRVRN